MLKFKHSGNTGDVIASLAAVKNLCEQADTRAIIYLWLDRPAFYYTGAIHPVQTDGQMVMLNERMFDMIKPLLMSQAYVSDVIAWKGEKVDVDLDQIRDKYVGLPYGAIQRWYFYAFPNAACDLNDPWINFSDREKPDNEFIIVNRTERYTNPNINYFFLRNYNCKFAGTEKERQIFNKTFDLNIEPLGNNDFRELAIQMKRCKFFIGNQSSCWNLAEAMKVPRVLEVCGFAPNCIPYGKNAYDFYHQIGLEYYVEKLFTQNHN